MNRPLRRLLPTMLVAAVAFGLWQLAASFTVAADLARILLFAAAGIGLVAVLEFRGAGNMKGCMTFMALLLLPAFGLAMAGVDRLAAMPELDPLVGWAGGFRVPAFLAVAAGALGFVFFARQKFFGKSRIRISSYTETVLITVFFALVGGVTGLVWMALDYGLRQVGL